MPFLGSNYLILRDNNKVYFDSLDNIIDYQNIDNLEIPTTSGWSKFTLKKLDRTSASVKIINTKGNKHVSLSYNHPIFYHNRDNVGIHDMARMVLFSDYDHSIQKIPLNTKKFDKYLNDFQYLTYNDGFLIGLSYTAEKYLKSDNYLALKFKNINKDLADHIKHILKYCVIPCPKTVKMFNDELVIFLFDYDWTNIFYKHHNINWILYNSNLNNFCLDFILYTNNAFLEGIVDALQLTMNFVYERNSDLYIDQYVSLLKIQAFITSMGYYSSIDKFSDSNLYTLNIDKNKKKYELITSADQSNTDPIYDIYPKGTCKDGSVAENIILPNGLIIPFSN